ncbi:hypothetical protein N7468_000800 [Penicillium chermesinum]|uniref:Cupin type-2 domain-containing protein n=1 Tax=Penicillium chermesinum TaxID=63820 RepID=A0A9W9PIE2_9EURO|nr:uncharacterized protein N7468_000800 [Penicillium chermesinum]KAJ5245817.1 hypothetical protein N7468_000800 [Penicillium chermesinum]
MSSAEETSPTIGDPYTNPSEASRMPPVTRYITGHNAAGKAIVQSSSQISTNLGDHFRPGVKNDMGFNVVYATSQFPPNLNDDADIAAHERITQSGLLGLTNPNGVVLRAMDFPPGAPAALHRTQSLDYGIVLHGEVEMVMEEGEPVRLRPGDIAIQRATIHGWRNPSATEWARVIFVLQACQPVTVNGIRLEEDLGHLEPHIKPSEPIQ